MRTSAKTKGHLSIGSGLFSSIASLVSIAAHDLVALAAAWVLGVFSVTMLALEKRHTDRGER